MRLHHRARTEMGLRAVPITLPAAIAGSIALALTSAPAQAAEGPRERSDRPGSAFSSTGSDRAIALRAPAAAVPATYTVVRGDTISGIASRFGLRTQDVLALNGLGWKSVIHPGQVLRLIAAPAAAAAKPAAKPTAGMYTVVRGDTVSGIAQRHGVSIQSVFSANGLGWASIIYPGQKLTIPGKTAAAPAAPSIAGLDAEQIANARIIIQVGRQLGVSDKGIAIALGTAMQESWIRNLDWGDRDSLGLFQQRPSTGWGTAAQVRDPYRAARAFYGGPSDPNGSRTRGLLDIPGWQSMSFAQAAQAVQISAYPDRYARWEKPAYGWLAALG